MAAFRQGLHVTSLTAGRAEARGTPFFNSRSEQLAALAIHHAMPAIYLQLPDKLLALADEVIEWGVLLHSLTTAFGTNAT